VHDELDYGVPAHVAVGVYATDLAAWYTAYELVLDFVSETRLAPVGETPLEVVARIRIPVGFALDLMKRVNATMAEYERLYGDIHRPEER
jgi:hypothetical protein